MPVRIQDGNQLEQGMEKVMDISKTGRLLETHHLVESETSFVGKQCGGVKEDLIDIKCKFVYSKNSEFETYHTGIKFYEK